MNPRLISNLSNSYNLNFMNPNNINQNPNNINLPNFNNISNSMKFNNNMFNPNANNNMLNPNVNNNILNPNFNNNMNNLGMNQNMAAQMTINYNINNMNINMNNSCTNTILNGTSLTNINNFAQPSNLISPAVIIKKNNNDCLRMNFLLNNYDYILEIEKLNDYNSLYFLCQLKEDATLLYEYSCVKTFDELKKMNLNFMQCENIKQIFNVLINIFQNLNRQSKPRIDLMNEKIALYFISPNLNGKYEDTIIWLDKKDRDVKEQFNVLQCKYMDLYTNFKDIQKIAWSSGFSGSKLEKIKEICGKPDKND